MKLEDLKKFRLDKASEPELPDTSAGEWQLIEDAAGTNRWNRRGNQHAAQTDPEWTGAADSNWGGDAKTSFYPAAAHSDRRGKGGRSVESKQKTASRAWRG